MEAKNDASTEGDRSFHKYPRLSCKYYGQYVQVSCTFVKPTKKSKFHQKVCVSMKAVNASVEASSEAFKYFYGSCPSD